MKSWIKVSGKTVAIQQGARKASRPTHMAWLTG